MGTTRSSTRTVQLYILVRVHVLHVLRPQYWYSSTSSSTYYASLVRTMHSKGPTRSTSTTSILFIVQLASTIAFHTRTAFVVEPYCSSPVQGSAARGNASGILRSVSTCKIFDQKPAHKTHMPSWITGERAHGRRGTALPWAGGIVRGGWPHTRGGWPVQRPGEHRHTAAA